MRVLRESEELAEMARAEGKPLHGELRMGVIPTIAPFLLPAMLPRLRAQWPNLKLFLREETSQAACEALHRGQLDCVLLALPLRLRRGRQGAAVRRPPVRRLPRAAKRPRDLRSTPGAIDENRLLLLEDGHCLKDHALSACNRPELRAEAAMMGTSLHTLVQMVDNGLGLTFVPGMAIDAGILEGTGVDARPLTPITAFDAIALIWRRSSPRESEFQLLAETLRQIVGDHCAEHSPAISRRSARTGLRPVRGADSELGVAGSGDRRSARPSCAFCCRSKRSAFMTLVQALTKSRTNFSSLPFSA